MHARAYRAQTAKSAGDSENRCGRHLVDGFDHRLVDNLHTRHPEIGIEIVGGPLGQVGRLLAERRIDIAIKARPAGLRAKPVDRKAGDLFGEPLVLLVPPNHPLRGRKTVTLGDLDGEPFIARMHCENGAMLTKSAKKAGVKLRVVGRTYQDERAVTLVERGLGVAIVPAHAGSIEAVKIPFAEPTLARIISLENQRVLQKPR